MEEDLFTLISHKFSILLLFSLQDMYLLSIGIFFIQLWLTLGHGGYSNVFNFVSMYSTSYLADYYYSSSA